MTPKFRQILYVVGVIAFAALTVLSTFKVIDPHTAASVSATLTWILGLFGVTVAGTAAYTVNKQQKDGVFDRAEVSPADQIIKGLDELRRQKEAAEAAVDSVRDAVVSSTKDVPVLGPLTQQALDRILNNK